MARIVCRTLEIISNILGKNNLCLTGHPGIFDVYTNASNALEDRNKEMLKHKYGHGVDQLQMIVALIRVPHDLFEGVPLKASTFGDSEMRPPFHTRVLTIIGNSESRATIGRL